MAYELIVVGCSLGGLAALGRLLGHLPDEVDLPVVIAQHRSPESLRGGFERSLGRQIARPVAEAGDKDPIERGHVYVAPADYHLLAELGRFALSVDEAVRFARPAIDVLFESAADAYGPGVIGVVLTGANDDGADGLARIVARGGAAVVQDPATAQAPEMPKAALAAAPQATVLPLDRIGPHVAQLCAVEAA